MSKEILFWILAIMIAPAVMAALDDSVETMISPEKLPPVSAAIEDKTKFFLEEKKILDTKSIRISKSFNESDDEAFVFYKQEYKGVPVYNSLVGVIVRHGEVVMVKKRYYDNLNVNTTPGISPDEAKAIVTEDCNIDSQAPELVIYPVKAGKLAWRVKTHLHDMHKFDYFIDAHTGEIIDKISLVRPASVTGRVTGMVFTHNATGPQKLKNFSNVNVSIFQSGSFVTSALTNASGEYNVTGLTGEVLIYSNFSGPYVKVINDDEAAKNHTFLINATGRHDWNWNKSDTSTSNVESNAFYHINLIHDYFVKGEPFNINAMNFQMPITVRKNIFSNGVEVCNAFFTASPPSITMGQKCDLDLSADVIYHEYTHGVVDQVYINLPYRDMTGAVNEALADYFAATLTNDSRIAEKPHFNPYLRNLDNNQKYPADYTVTTSDNGNVHGNSRILSGAIWDVRESLGPSYADNYTIKAMKMQSASFTEFLEAFLVIDDNNTDLSDGTPNKDAICAAFAGHGIQSVYCNASLDGFTLKVNVSRTFQNARASGQKVSAAESGDNTAGMADDDITSAIDIGFTFPYYHRTYTQLYIGSNGFVTFVPFSNPSSFTYCALPDLYAPNATVAVYCDDLDPGSGGDVYYWRDNTSSPKKFTVEWFDVVRFGTTNKTTMEVTFYENGTIVMNYNSTQDNGFTGAVGLENLEGTAATTYFNASDLDNMDPIALEFIPFNKAPNTTAFSPKKTFSVLENVTLAFNHTTSDPDHDELTYAWYVNGTLKSTNANFSILFNLTDSGTYNITLVITDIYLSKITHSWNITVNDTNLRPVASKVSVIPLAANTDSNLTCNYTYSDGNNDPENGTIIRWFTNGTVNSSLENLTSIASGNTTRGQIWSCEVTPKDGALFGNSTKSSNLTIANALPVISSLNLVPSEAFKTTANITCNASGTDSDGDTVNITYRWFRNQIDIKHNLTFITNNSYSRLQNITCEVTPFDGISNGTRVNVTLTVSNLAPSMPTKLSVSNNGTIGGKHKTNLTITCNGSSDGDSDKVFYNLQALLNSSWVSIANATNETFKWNVSRFKSGDNITIRCNATDLINSSSFLNVSTFLTIDNTAPRLSTTLSNNSYFNKPNITINYTATDARKDKCILTNITGGINVTSSCGNITYINLADGLYNITISANDTLGNTNTTTLFFRIDTTKPGLNTSITETVSTTTATISFGASEQVNATINYGSSSSLGTKATNTSYTINKTFKITGLSTGVKYFYNLTLCDRADNCFIKSDYFTTTASSASGSSSSTSGGGSSGGGGGGGGSGGGFSASSRLGGAQGKVKRTFTDVKAGTTASLKIFNALIAAKKIDVKVKHSVPKFSVTVQALDARPTSIPKDIEGKVYRYISIIKQNIEDEEIDYATIKFEVAESWIKENNVKQDLVRLYRWTGEWTELETKFKSKTNSTLIYTAVTPGFSVFAIGAAIGAEPEAVGVTGEIVQAVPEKALENFTQEREEAFEENPIAQDFNQGEAATSQRIHIILRIIFVTAGVVILIIFLKTTSISKKEGKGEGTEKEEKGREENQQKEKVEEGFEEIEEVLEMPESFEDELRDQYKPKTKKKSK